MVLDAIFLIDARAQSTAAAFTKVFCRAQGARPVSLTVFEFEHNKIDYQD